MIHLLLKVTQELYLEDNGEVLSPEDSLDIMNL